VQGKYERRIQFRAYTRKNHDFVAAIVKGIGPDIMVHTQSKSTGGGDSGGIENYKGNNSLTHKRKISGEGIAGGMPKVSDGEYRREH